MARVTLVNLETICCIARLGTFAAAAEKMHASQPAISARVRETEIAMGVELFRRQGRRMELTQQGRELVEMVEPLLQRLRGAVGAIDNAAAATGTVRMGVGEIAALSWFPTFMSRLRERMPRVNYQIDVDLTVSMAEKLQAGKIDMALLAGPLAGPNIRTESIGRVRMNWFVAPGLLDSQCAAATPAERLMSQTIWSLPTPSAVHAMTMSMCRDLGAAPESVSVCNHTLALIGMIVAGAGAAMLPEVLVRGHVAKSELVCLLPDVPSPELEFVIAWQQASEQTVTRNIVELARQCTSFDLPASITG